MEDSAKELAQAVIFSWDLRGGASFSGRSHAVAAVPATAATNSVGSVPSGGSSANGSSGGGTAQGETGAHAPPVVRQTGRGNGMRMPTQHQLPAQLPPQLSQMFYPMPPQMFYPPTAYGMLGHTAPANAPSQVQNGHKNSAIWVLARI